MSPNAFMFALLAASLAAGLLGSLTGLGGGVILTSVLVLAMGVDMKYAVGASLVAVIATSSGGAGGFVRTGFVNLRLALFLEVATVAGALLGALLASHTPSPVLQVVFGTVLLWTAWNAWHVPRQPHGVTDHRTSTPAVPSLPHTDATSLEDRLRLHGETPAASGSLADRYRVRRAGLGFCIMLAAGVLSALAGIGSGIVKVLALERVMGLPLKVSTTTSNFMIGATAAASAGVFLHRGQIEPTIAAPVALGALAGSVLGSRLLPRMRTRTLRTIFNIIIAGAGIQMIWKGCSAG